MTIDDIVNLAQQAMYVTLMAAAPMLLTGMAVGLFISILQSVTQIQEITLTFRVAATINGTVLNPNGTPAAGASIEVREGARLRYGARADRHGRFTASVPADEPGPWTIHARVRGESWKAKITDVRTGAAGIRLQLK